MRNSYFHIQLPEITTDFLNEGVIVSRQKYKPSHSEILDIALLGYRIALRIGIQPSIVSRDKILPYSPENDNLVFDCPLNSILVGRQMFFLRGWKKFDSCIKGFNSVGLLAEPVKSQLQQFQENGIGDISRRKKLFLLSRKNEIGERVFSSSEVDKLTVEDLSELHILDLALWTCFSDKTIVCSTSSNMGISLHQFLRYMQGTVINWKGKEFTLLNKDEGSLVIWCPDEQADFMNKEKSDLLRSIEAEKPPLTRLRTYINRIQRDPGALRDALLCGGYFFPTNPQSFDEVQNLLFVAMSNIAEERGQTIEQLFVDDKIKAALTNLGCEIGEEKIYVDKGIEGGISGLMIPYLIMLEETIGNGKVKGVSTWNQASIGAALAAAVLADEIIRKPDGLSEHTRAELNTLFPNISRFLDSKKLGREIATRVHGVFDLANLQSLAQLLGVVVEKHLSGRGTAYVGLGSSSYSNGNRCYEILRESMEEDGSFRGKSTFHPATHTLNPFSQALIYGEELYRVSTHGDFATLSTQERIKYISQRVRKAEPAGAAAMAGYLLTRLDAGTLSLIEIAYMLRLMGFTKSIFLEFCKLPPDDQGVNKFLQEAYEEGVYMGDLAKNIFLLLDWSLDKIEKKVAIEREHSRLKYKLYPIEDQWFDDLNPKVHIYLTGDNTSQPGSAIIQSLMTTQAGNTAIIARLIEEQLGLITGNTGFDRISLTSRFFTKISLRLNSMDSGVNKKMKRVINRQITNRVNAISQSNQPISKK
jgi:hypothetical protein